MLACPKSEHKPCKSQFIFYSSIIFCKLTTFLTEMTLVINELTYEDKSISNQPIPFPIDRDGHDFHALFQHMFIPGYIIARVLSHYLIRY